VRVIALDKRTGRRLYDKEVVPYEPFHKLTVAPQTVIVELIRADMRIRFVPDDGKPKTR
jgi:hypothetical protein